MILAKNELRSDSTQPSYLKVIEIKVLGEKKNHCEAYFQFGRVNLYKLILPQIATKTLDNI